LKSINKTELAVFNDLAKDYSDRICGDSGSFLTKFFGVFKVKFGKTPAFFLVLMENLTGNLGDPLLFDIKGSTKNRRASVEEFNDISEMPRNIVYKDLDFKVNVGSLVIPEEVYRKISEIVEKDAELLMNFKIMDYSLMVVVGSKKQLKVTLIDRFIINCHNQLLTYIGIIDFLQCYNTRKKLENKYRTFNHDPKEPSCIPPKPYKSRFQEKVQSLFSFS
jgi:1-phosphatidylinositol-4-phosphate 5-kinase